MLKWVKTLGVVRIEWMNFAARLWILGGQGQNAMDLIVYPIHLYIEVLYPNEWNFILTELLSL